MRNDVDCAQHKYIFHLCMQCFVMHPILSSSPLQILSSKAYQMHASLIYYGITPADEVEAGLLHATDCAGWTSKIRLLDGRHLR